MTVPRTINEIIENQAALRPAAVAIAAPGRDPLLFSRLRDHVHEVRSSLRRMGIGHDDRVAVMLPNGPEMAVAFLSVVCSSACLPLNPGLRVEDVAERLPELRVKAVISNPSAWEKCPIPDGVPLIELSPMTEAEAGLFTLNGRSLGPPLPERVPESQDVAMVLHTAGTTSRPKCVPLTHANVCASVRHIQDLFKLTETDRRLNVMPLFHVQGLVGGVLASIAAGGACICAPGFDPTSFFKWMDETSPTWYSAVPLMHRAIIAQSIHHEEIIARRRLRFIRIGSYSLPEPERQQLEKIFDAPALEAYGMTETASQIACNPLPPLERKAGSVGIVAGPEVMLLDEVGQPAERGSVGEIVVRGPNVMSAYENSADANAKAFTADGWLRTGDIGYFDDDGYLFLKGRSKEMINRSGEKIAPREIEEVIMAHPAVIQAVAFAVPHPRLGEEPAVAVVLREPGSVTDRAIRDFCRAALPYFKVPSHVVFVQELPKGPTGKLLRIGLAEILGVFPSSEGSRSEFVAPRTPTEQTIAAVCCEHLKVEKIGVEDDLLLLADSFDIGFIAARIREQTGVPLSLDTIFRSPTVAELARLIVQERPDGSDT